MNGPAATVTLEAAFSREDRFAAGLLDPDIAIPDFVGGRGPGVADRRYAVYRNNVVVGLIDALKAAFPRSTRSWARTRSSVSGAISSSPIRRERR